MGPRQDEVASSSDIRRLLQGSQEAWKELQQCVGKVALLPAPPSYPRARLLRERRRGAGLLLVSVGYIQPHSGLRHLVLIPGPGLCSVS